MPYLKIRNRQECRGDGGEKYLYRPVGLHFHLEHLCRIVIGRTTVMLVNYNQFSWTYHT